MVAGTPPMGASSSPEMVRAFLSGISMPPAGEPEGALTLGTVDEDLADAVIRAEQLRLPFTLMLARPGAAGRQPAPPASQVEDLAAALSVSLLPAQELLRGKEGHLAVVIPGSSRREAVLLARRAAGGGAPLFSWAAARFPKDATTAAGLLQVAAHRLDGAPGDWAVPEAPARGGRRGVAGLWAGVAAAVVVGAAAFAMHGTPQGSTTAAGQVPGSAGQASTTAGAGGV